MARKTKSNALSLWANGTRVGTWILPPRGEMELRYDDSWIRSPLGRALSLSLPLPLLGLTPLKGNLVRHYFENLLPDSEVIRNRLASRFGTDSTSAFDLLSAIGRDCVGALQLLGEDEVPQGIQSITGDVLDEAGVEKTILAAAGGGPVLGAHDDDEDFRISIAGAHEKTALLHHNGQWIRPHGATPTTHIMKLPLGKTGRGGRIDMSDSVENEWLCSQLFKAYGLPVAECSIEVFGSQRVLAVKRFDRRMHSSGEWILRLPQEDFCQAYGISPRQKYETDGGPSALDLVAILQNSTHAKLDLETFFCSQVLFWALAATDGHAKNFSLHIEPGGQYRLAPLYDILSIWPYEGPGDHQINGHKAKLAMGVKSQNKHYRIKEIQRRHFHAFGQRLGLDVNADALVARLIAATPGVIAKVSGLLPGAFPELVATRTLEGLGTSMEKLDKMPN